MDRGIGTVAPGFEPVREVFADLFRKQWELGAAYAVYLDGELAVHLHGGVRGRADPLPYDEQVLQLVASTTKFAESACVALFVDRGLLRYDDRIAQHWPDFVRGDARKAEITVRQLMMHRAGLPVFDAKLTDAELFDHGRLASFLMRQPLTADLFRREPRDGGWRLADPPPPQAYHAVSRGLYTSVLLSRVDSQHRTLGRIFRDEIAAPLGLEFWIGLPESEEPRVAPFHPDTKTVMALLGSKADVMLDRGDPRHQLLDYEMDFLRDFITRPDSFAHRALSCLAPDGVAPHELGGHRKIRACELPSSNGVANARALAKLAALVAQGGVLEGHRIFASPRALQQAVETAARYAIDGVMKTPVAFTQGGFARLVAQDEAQTVTFGWGGAGGSMIRFVPELRLGCGYVTNTGGARMAMNDPRPNALLRATLDCMRAARR